MKITANTYLLIGIFFFITACVKHDILFKEDGTAHVRINCEELIPPKGDPIYDSIPFSKIEDTLVQLYKSNAVKNFKIDTTSSDSPVLDFDITNIDSLGNYLSPFIPYLVTFKLNKNKLIITGSDGKADSEDDVGGYTNLIPVNTTLRFEKKIKSIATKNKYIKLVDHHTIEINTSLGEMEYYGQKNQLEVDLK